MENQEIQINLDEIYLWLQQTMPRTSLIKRKRSIEVRTVERYSVILEANGSFSLEFDEQHNSKIVEAQAKELANYLKFQLNKVSLIDRRVLHLYQLSKKQTSSSQKVAKLLTYIFPENWRIDLEELHCNLLDKGCSKLIVNLIMFRSILEMVWASLWIKWEDCISPISMNYSEEVATNVNSFPEICNPSPHQEICIDKPLYRSKNNT